ncbi:MAG: tryptophan/tyrosine permease [Deltaproteobacteria bacterium]|nr:tryptophan/tyrosine permease [Deltaproteobacteria bacterium]
MSVRPSLSIMVTVSFLVVGNLIGVGILALPINTGLAGFIPALAGMVLLGGAMFFSAMVLAREAVQARKETFNLPSLYGAYLGRTGKWVAILANMLILYGLLVAYLTGGTTIIGNIFGLPEQFNWLVTLIFFAVLTGTALMKVDMILKYNSLIMICLFIFFGLMVGIGETNVESGALGYMDWRFLPYTAPIIVTAFHFHNIIPDVCTSLKWDLSAVWKTMLGGMLIGFVMNAVWIQVGIGVLPLEGTENSLLAAFEQNLPATVPMSAVIHSKLFLVASLVFSLLAIMTSYLANGMGLLSFIRDMTENQFHFQNRSLAAALTFGPPLAIALLWPDVFLTAINVVGGVGIVVLFGILPSLIFLRKNPGPGTRVLGLIMLVLFLVCLGLEIGQEAGLLHIHPEVEHWHPQLDSIPAP